jgi:riboflavin kinase/FMN adenylyltransferase
MQNAALLSHSFSSQVLSGEKLGRTIGFPTLNLDFLVFPPTNNPGVYACSVQLSNQVSYQAGNNHSKTSVGALCFGPRLVKGETSNVLKIFILDFEDNAYDQVATVQLHSFIRPPIAFASFEEMKTQLELDVEQIRKSVQVD